MPLGALLSIAIIASVLTFPIRKFESESLAWSHRHYLCNMEKLDRRSPEEFQVLTAGLKLYLESAARSTERQSVVFGMIRDLNALGISKVSRTVLNDRGAEGKGNKKKKKEEKLFFVHAQIKGVPWWQLEACMCRGRAFLCVPFAF